MFYMQCLTFWLLCFCPFLCVFIYKLCGIDFISRFTPIPISALSGTGTGELLDLVCSGLNKLEVCNGLSFFQKNVCAGI